MQISKIKKMFGNTCCSNCKADFEETSFQIMRDEDDFIVLRVRCQECGKSFGLAFLGINVDELNQSIKETDSNLAINLEEGPPPIGFDDVIFAHDFIKSMEDNWHQYIPKDFKPAK